MTTRERIHRAMRTADKRGCANLPHCAFKELPDFDCTLLCDALAEEFATARKDALTEAYRAIANLCDPCRKCGTTGDCERCQALAMAEQVLARLRNGEALVADNDEEDECNCNPADRTGGGHDPKCPEFDPSLGVEPVQW